MYFCMSRRNNWLENSPISGKGAGELRAGLGRYSIAMPDYSAVAGGPGFVAVGNQFAMLGVSEFDADDVRRQGFAVRDRLNLGPVLAGVRGVIESTGRASNPDIGIVCRKSAEDDAA